MGKFGNLVVLIIGLLQAAPAHAASSLALPDPSGVTLLALGVAGVLIGRRMAANRKD